MKQPAIITIDGAAGEGGGQILRTSLALSLVTGKPFRITNIRAGRKKPGLLRQQLTAVSYLTAAGLASKGDHLVIVSDMLAGEERFDTIQLRVV